MEVNNSFYLSGFERKNLGLGGMAFYRYERTEASAATPTIRSWNTYGDRTEYRLELPKPAEKRVTGAVIISRPSKNRYKVAMSSERGVRIFDAESLTAIETAVNGFFTEAKR